MKKSLWVLTILALSLVLGMSAFASGAKTGDGKLDAYLKNLNVQAEADIRGYTVNLSTHFGVAQREVEILIKKVEKPADAYMALKVARIASKPLDVVLTEYQANRGKGWGVIAKNLGIKPGSPEFHALKKGDFGSEGPGQGRGKGHGKGHGNGRGHDKDD